MFLSWKITFHEESNSSLLCGIGFHEWQFWAVYCRRKIGNESSGHWVKKTSVRVCHVADAMWVRCTGQTNDFHIHRLLAIKKRTLNEDSKNTYSLVQVIVGYSWRKQEAAKRQLTNCDNTSFWVCHLQGFIRRQFDTLY